MTAEVPEEWMALAMRAVADYERQTPYVQSGMRGYVAAVITAVAPKIRADERAKVAEEITAWIEPAPPKGNLLLKANVLRFAAEIARGESS